MSGNGDALWRAHQPDPRGWSLGTPGAGIEVSPSEVQFALLPILLQEAGRRTSLRITEHDILLRY